MRQAWDFCVCPHAHTTVDTPLVSLLPPILWAGGDASTLPFWLGALLSPPLLRAGPQPPGHRVTAWHRRTASHPIPYEALMVVLQGELHPIYNYMPDIHKMAPCRRRQAESRQLSLPPRSWSWHEKPPRRLNLNCT